MPDSFYKLNEVSKMVFTEVRTHKAMPLLEIAAHTGIRGEVLTEAVKGLENDRLVVVKGADPLEMIVSVSGKDY